MIRKQVLSLRSLIEEMQSVAQGALQLSYARTVQPMPVKRLALLRKRFRAMALLHPNQSPTRLTLTSPAWLA